MHAKVAAHTMRRMLDGKNGNLSLVMHPCIKLDMGKFGNGARDVWERDALSKYNGVPAPFVSANSASALQQRIMRRDHELLRPVGDAKNGVNSLSQRHYSAEHQ